MATWSRWRCYELQYANLDRLLLCAGHPDGRLLNPMPGPSDTAQVAKSVSFADIAVPADTYLDHKNSVVIGEGALWTGHLLAETDLAPTQVSNHLKSQMLAKGWTLLSSVHSGSSTYLFCNAQKLMSIDVAPKGLFSSGSALTYVASFYDNSSSAQPGARICR